MSGKNKPGVGRTKSEVITIAIGTTSDIIFISSLSISPFTSNTCEEIFCHLLSEKEIAVEFENAFAEIIG